MSEHYFTGSLVADFLVLIIPPLPGCVAYAIAKETITGAGPLSSILPVLIGLAVLSVFYPLTYRVVKHIRESVPK